MFKNSDREHDWNLYLNQKNQIPGVGTHRIFYSQVKANDKRAPKIVTGDSARVGTNSILSADNPVCNKLIAHKVVDLGVEVVNGETVPIKNVGLKK